MATVGAITMAPAIAGDCPAKVSARCARYADDLTAGLCLKPGTILVKTDKWVSAARTKIPFDTRRRVHFVYVVDGTNTSAAYDSIFVGVDRVGQQTAHSDVILTQNWSFRFKTEVQKPTYSRAITDGPLTQKMRQWSYLPDVGNVFLLKDSDITAEFNIPQAISDSKHAPHARLYRFETGSISCIPFSVGLNSDVDVILGKVVDSSEKDPILFRVTIE